MFFFPRNIKVLYLKIEKNKRGKKKKEKEEERKKKKKERKLDCTKWFESLHLRALLLNVKYALWKKKQSCVTWG